MPWSQPAAEEHRRRRPGAFVGVLVLVLAACGGSELSLTEYVDEINAASGAAIERAEQLTAQGDIGGGTPTPEEAQSQILLGIEEIRDPLQEAVDAIDPPTQIADLHALLWDWHADFISTERAMAERMGTIPNTLEGWTALSNSPEMAAYRDSLAEGKQVCIDFQAELDATEARGVFDGVAWVPSEFSEVVSAALGCEFFPDDPASVFQVPPP